jgi:acetoin utilization deacetylase AcuC-like enzyme
MNEFTIQPCTDRTSCVQYSDKISSYFISPKECLRSPDNVEEVSKRWSTIDTQLRSQTNIEEIVISSIDDNEFFSSLKYSHSDRFMSKLKHLCSTTKGNNSVPFYTEEVEVNECTWNAIKICTSAVLQAVNRITSNLLKNNLIFCNIRPPGHHAGYSSTSGFCVVNNAANCAIHALQNGEINNVAIFDIDTHFCDGTNDIVSNFKLPGKRIQLYSIHEMSSFPDTRLSNKLIHDKENKHFRALPQYCPLGMYMETFKELIDKLKVIGCDMIIGSFGMDSVQGDPIGKFPLLPSTFNEITRELLSICPRMIILTEGGYNMENLKNCTRECTIFL